jgi:hypothetical protein
MSNRYLNLRDDRSTGEPSDENAEGAQHDPSGIKDPFGFSTVRRHRMCLPFVRVPTTQRLPSLAAS